MDEITYIPAPKGYSLTKVLKILLSPLAVPGIPSLNIILIVYHRLSNYSYAILHNPRTDINYL